MLGISRILLALFIGAWLSLVIVIITDISKEFAFADASRLEDSIIKVTNEVRVNNGLNPLIKDDKLTLNAERYAIVNANHGKISHEHEPLITRMPEHCISIGENLYQGRDDAQGIVGAWLRSPSHRENILDPEWDRIGVGMARSGYQIIVVQLFCSTR
jgi:uncharacterized protein YkwD